MSWMSDKSDKSVKSCKSLLPGKKQPLDRARTSPTGHALNQQGNHITLPTVYITTPGDHITLPAWHITKQGNHKRFDRSMSAVKHVISLMAIVLSALSLSHPTLSAEDGSVRYARMADLHSSEGYRSVVELRQCIRDINTSHPTLSAEDGTVRFALMADLHYSEGSRSAVDLRRCIRDINTRENLDFVMVAGDLTDFGTDEEISAVKNMLDSLDRPYYVVPGNHDAKWSESGCNTFRKVFGYETFEFL